MKRQVNHTERPCAAGVSLNGWLQLEEWFFSSDAFTVVDSAVGPAKDCSPRHRMPFTLK